MKTVEKNLSSNRPNPSRTTPMNHKKAMPANGMIIAAVLRFVRPGVNHCAPGSAPSGSAIRMRTSAVPNSRAKSTPAIAAARGVASCATGDRLS